ncbi:flavin reductase [Williamsia soli]|uniref:flavin reductase n=1 Tax=Williamsia soli TaxID=364929 RepID=UPI001A9CF579|nr:flavin reductase [Williamsia soli]
MTRSFTSEQFRQVLGQYPTGVVVVTAVIPDGQPIALTIGSFSSVSLEPPLVAFYPSIGSSTWPKIQAHGRFCINVLGAGQEALCRAFASKASDKFDGVTWRPSPGGSPIIEGAVAWIDCDLDDVQTLGDHFLVVGRVNALETASRDLPLLFFRGGYGRFLHSSLAASESALAGYLPVVEAVRSELESVADDCGTECNLAAHTRDEFIVLAGAGSQASPQSSAPTRVGRRLPYLAPIGTTLAAWGDESDIKRWAASIDREAGDGLTQWLDVLSLVRRRGYVIGRGETPYAAMEEAIDKRRDELADPTLLGALSEVRKTMLDQPSLDSAEETYDIRSLSVPIFLADGRVVQMGLYGLQADMSGEAVRFCAQRLLQAARRCTALLGGTLPEDFPRPTDSDGIDR